jgi:hypothetical protein
MKKVFLFLALTIVTFSTNSCSSDSSGSTGTITFKVNGNPIVLDKISVVQTIHQAGTPHEYTQLDIVGQRWDNNQWAKMSLRKGVLEDDAFYFMYGESNLGHESFIPYCNVQITTNEGHTAKGTFSGELAFLETSFIVSEGSFDIKF